MKRPAHLTLVDADKIGAVFTQRTEWRERAEKAEARIEALERLAAAEHDRGDYLAGAEPVGGTESLYLRLDAARKEVEALATREKALCRHCGKPESNSKHTRYGPDLDNPVKHEFEPPEQTLPNELTPETLRAVFHALWHSRMLVPGPTEEDCLAHVSAWAADRKRIEALEKTGQDLLDILAAEMGDVPASLKVAERLLAFKAALRREEER